MKTRFFIALTVFLLSGSVALAQSPGAKPKDDDLDDLLKKVEQKDQPKTKDVAKPKAKADDKPASPSDKPKTKGEVSGKDKELDDLLGKIGETKDEPTPEEKKPPAQGESEEDDKHAPAGGGQDQKKNQKKKEELSGDQQQLDEHLKELSGKREQQKKKQGGGDGKQQAGEDQGPLGDLVKQMREVEERLGKPDTGEQTRQKQTEIVKKMDTMIEQMKQAKNQQQAMRMMRKGQKPGQPGQQPNGDLAQGPPATKPAKPDGKSIVALDKNAWGHLPPDLRAEMENVFKEDLLPSRADLIKRYYLSVSKKSMTREE